MRKRGFAGVSAIAIAIVVVGFFLVGVVMYNSIVISQDRNGDDNLCLAVVDDLLFIDSRYNCFVSDSFTSFSVGLYDEISAFRAVLQSELGAEEELVFREGGVSSNVRSLSTGFGDTISLPRVGESETYVIDGTYDSVSIYPVVEEGISCGLSDSIALSTCDGEVTEALELTFSDDQTEDSEETTGGSSGGEETSGGSGGGGGGGSSGGSDSGDSGDSNDPPIAIISNPVEQAIYFVNETIIFSHSSNDEGALIVEWSIVEDSFSTNNASFDYVFTSEGVKTIILNVTDDEGISDETRMHLLALADSGIFAHINEPAHQEVIQTINVDYNANESYVVHSGGQIPCPVVTCLAGNCPEETANAPSSCLSETISVSGILDGGYDGVYFNWSFEDGSSEAHGFVNGSVVYLPTEGEKTIGAVLTYDNVSLGISLTEMVEQVFVHEPPPLLPPSASFSATPQNGTVPLSVLFNASDSFDLDGTIVSYEWNFGDGNVSVNSFEEIIHEYIVSGDYVITLTVTDNDGLTHTVNSQNVSVFPDSDGDGIADENDLCPNTAGGDVVDSFGCSEQQVDMDGDGVCDPGQTSDLWCSGSDNCPSDPNAGQEDFDGDGLGDVCDSQTCGNGVWESGEQCDGSDLNQFVCADLGFGGGTLGCFPAGHPQECEFDTTQCIAVPSAPTGLSAVAISDSQIDLTWTDTSDNEDEFIVERDTDPGFASAVSFSVSADGESFSDSGLLSDTVYFYRVFARNTAGDSGYSNTASATTSQTPDVTPPQFSGVTTSPQSPVTYAPGQNYLFEITWIDDFAVAGAILEFDGVSYEMSGIGDVYSVLLTDLAAGTYQYRFIANDSSGNSNQTAVTSYVIDKENGAVSLLLNGNADNLVVTYPETVSAVASSTTGPITLLRNSEDVTSENGIAVVLGGGGYFYTAQAAETENYTSAEVFFAVDVLQSQTTCSISHNAPVTYPALVTVSASCDNPEASEQLWRDGGDVSEENDVAVLLGAGTYSYFVVVVGTQNYTSDIVFTSVVVDQATTQLTLSVSPGNSVDAGTETTVTGSDCPASATCALFRDSIPVPNPDIAILPAGTYSYEYNTTGNQNYTDNSTSESVIVTTPTYTLSVGLTGTGSGSVASVPSGISCPSDCSEEYDADSIVTLSATPDAGSVFVGWSGACSGTGSCIVTMSDDESVSAQFDSLPSAPTGLSASAVSNDQIDLSWTDNSVNEVSFEIERSLTSDFSVIDASFSASANSESFSDSGLSSDTEYFYRVFARNAAGDSDYSNTDSATTLSDVFSLSVSVLGGGSGVVTSTPLGISCPSDCSEDYGEGVVVTLSASPNAGSVFVGWVGGSCDGLVTDCVVTMNVAHSESARFELLPSAPIGLSASAISASEIDLSWSDTSNDEDEFIVERDTDPGFANAVSFSVSANSESFSDTGLTGGTTYYHRVFARNNFGDSDYSNTASATTSVEQFLLSVSISGSGSGSVTSVPVGISCPGDCSEHYDSGSVVTLTASPNAGSEFVGWSGACSGAGSCVISMDGAETVDAQFDVTQPGLTSYSDDFVVAIGSNADIESFSDVTWDGFTHYSPSGVGGSAIDENDPNVVSVWHLDGDASDSTGANDGVISGANCAATGILGQACDFDGSDDSIAVGAFDVAGTELSITAWINPDGFLGPWNDNRIISKASGTAEQDHYFMLSTIDPNGASGDSFLRFRLKAGGTTDTLVANGAGNEINTGEWSHVAAVYDGTTMTLYLNGQSIGSAAHSVGGALDGNLGVSVAIGQNPGGEVLWDGRIDDAGIWDRALDGSEIDHIYQNGLGGSVSGTFESVDLNTNGVYYEITADWIESSAGTSMEISTDSGQSWSSVSNGGTLSNQDGFTGDFKYKVAFFDSTQLDQVEFAWDPTPPSSVCVSSSDTFQNFDIIPGQTGIFEASFSATPHNANMDGVTALSLGQAQGFGDLAAIIRFNTGGTIDVRDFDGYRADVSIPYSADTEYGFRAVVDVSQTTYSVYVTPEGQGEQLLASNYDFREGQTGISVLDNWALWSQAGTSHTVCDFTTNPLPDPVCGNGVIEIGETCDDSDNGDGDGCSSLCAIESGWECTGEPSVCSQLPECSDGIDNDGDGATDGSDYSCQQGGASEDEIDAQCQDGTDNDGDEEIDWPNDLGCVSYNDNDETDSVSSGWTDFTPSADTQIVYVSSSQGNDGSCQPILANDILVAGDDVFDPQIVPIQPCANLQTAYGLLRSGFPDWMLLQRGDTWDNDVVGRKLGEANTYDALWRKQGRDADEKMIIGAYGPDTTARPYINTQGLPGMRTGSGDPVDHFAIVSIDLDNGVTGNSYNGDHYGIFSFGDNDDWLIEDVRITGFTTNLAFVQPDGSTFLEGVAIRRSAIVDAHQDESKSPHSQGMYADGVDGLIIEESVFDHNGWKFGRNDATWGATVFNHNLYTQPRTRNAEVRGSIFSDGSSHGVQLRSGGSVDDNLVIRNAVGVQLGTGGAGGGGSNPPHPLSGFVRNNVILEGLDIKSGLGGGTAISTIWIDNGGAVEDNIVANQLSGGVRYALRISEDNGGTNGNHDVTVARNVFYDWQGPVRFEGSAPSEFENIVFSDNAVQEPSATNLLVDHTDPNYNELTSVNNQFWRSNGGSSWTNLGDLATWKAQVGDTTSTAEQVTYQDPTRDLAAYDAFIGGPGTYDNFIAMAREQRKGDWNAAYSASAANSYIRDGFVVVAGLSPPGDDGAEASEAESTGLIVTIIETVGDVIEQIRQFTLTGGVISLGEPVEESHAPVTGNVTGDGSALSPLVIVQLALLLLIIVLAILIIRFQKRTASW